MLNEKQKSSSIRFNDVTTMFKASDLLYAKSMKVQMMIVAVCLVLGMIALNASERLFERDKPKHGRGCLCKMLNTFPSAEVFDRAISANSQNAVAYEGRAVARCRKGETMFALRDIQTAIDLAPRRSYSHLIKAEILLSLSSPSAALAECDKACEIEPSNFMNFQERAQERAWAGKLDGAIKDLDRALELNPQDTWSLEYRSSLNVRRGDIMAATRDVVKYWSACPDKLFDPHDGLTAFVARTTKFLSSRAIKQ